MSESTKPNLRIDLSVQSFKKPELLIYTLLSLHRQSARHIETVFINDDHSGTDTLTKLQDPRLADALRPWNLRLRVNDAYTGYGWNFTDEMSIQHLHELEASRLPLRWLEKKALQAKYIGKKRISRLNIKYQWALESTDKEYLFVIHDDIRFHADVVAAYLDEMSDNPNCAIVGQLGQCWRCKFNSICGPDQILSGHRPSPHWPLTPYADRNYPKHYLRDCRINEWCCLLRTSVAGLMNEKAIYFGNCEDRGDTAAYWFGRAIALGYTFADPFPGLTRNEWFTHGWQGHPGHSVWEDQGTGKITYDAEFLKTAVLEEFGYRI